MRQWSCSKQETPQQKLKRLKRGKLEENESNEWQGKGDRTGYLPLSCLVWLRLADSYYVLCQTMSSSPFGPFPHPYLTSHLVFFIWLPPSPSPPGPPPTRGCLTWVDTTANIGHRKKGSCQRRALHQNMRGWQGKTWGPSQAILYNMKEPTRKWHGFPAAPWDWTDCVHRASSCFKPIPTVHTNTRHRCEETRVPSSLLPMSSRLCSSGRVWLWRIYTLKSIKCGFFILRTEKEVQAFWLSFSANACHSTPPMLRLVTLSNTAKVDVIRWYDVQ